MTRFAIGIAALVAISSLSAASVRAHDHNRPDLDAWFKALRASGGAICCDGADALSVEDPDWESRDGHYRVRVGGEWVDVPDEAVIKTPNYYGPTLVWPYTGYVKGVRCFLPGSMT